MAARSTMAPAASASARSFSSSLAHSAQHHVARRRLPSPRHLSLARIAVPCSSPLAGVRPFPLRLCRGRLLRRAVRFSLRLGSQLKHCRTPDSGVKPLPSANFEALLAIRNTKCLINWAGSGGRRNTLQVGRSSNEIRASLNSGSVFVLT